jgi:hypothetical protein
VRFTSGLNDETMEDKDMDRLTIEMNEPAESDNACQTTVPPDFSALPNILEEENDDMEQYL